MPTCDARRIRQVLTNLVENALRHTAAGGRGDGAQPVATASGVELAVADTGSGIPAEHLPHVFDRFYRADPSRNRATGGTGLGLAITRELVAAHGGRSTVDSLVGQGTTFTVRLPALAHRQPAPPEAPARPHAVRHRPRRRPRPRRRRPAAARHARGAETGPDGQAGKRPSARARRRARPGPPRPAPADFTYIDVD